MNLLNEGSCFEGFTELDGRKFRTPKQHKPPNTEHMVVFIEKNLKRTVSFGPHFTRNIF